jgi:hypothetical protein
MKRQKAEALAAVLNGRIVADDVGPEEFVVETERTVTRRFTGPIGKPIEPAWGCSLSVPCPS